MEHTPGPWEVTNSVKDRREFVISAQGGMWDLYKIAKVKSALKTDLDISKANARLIAAAPDLLKACKLVRKTYPNSLWIHEMVDKAIKKAEGRE